MKLGFLTAILAELDFKELVTFASKNGFNSLEVMCWPLGKAERRYAGVTHIDVNALDSGKKEEIQAILKNNNVSISALGYYPNPLEADEEKSMFYQNHIKKVIDAAKILDVGIITTFIGRDHTKSVDDNFEKFKRVWPPIVKYAEGQNVKIAIENCPMFFSMDEWPGGKNLASTPAIWRRMFDEIRSPNFGLNYDPSHLVWQQIDYIKPIEEFKDRIFHVHIKDAKIIYHKLNEVGIMATPLEYHSPKLPGLGDVNWGKFFSALTDIKYKGDVVVEVEDRAYEDSLDSRKSALIQSRNFVKQYLPLL